MAATRGILVQAGGRQFCVPTTAVERVLRFRQESVQNVEGSPTIEWQDQRIAYVSLIRLLDLPAPAAKEPKPYWVALIIREGEEYLALGVDHIIGEHEVLVKGLGAQITHIRHLAGATVLGDGELVPILHLPDLFHTMRHRFANAPGIEPAATAEQPPVRILVVDDSITTRMLIKNILEQAGFAVAVANDGAQALSMLRQEPFDLLLSDVEMPNLNGFELCRAIRQDANLAHLPVILCTSLGSPEDRRQGAEAGANAYMIKADFEHGQLLHLIAELIEGN
jgi:two-component system chemotaxis sensor kinase CheA